MAGKYVINGAKIKCPLCTKPEGKLMVTSNAVGVQGKFWATDADKGKPNLLFQGNCTKFTNNPPPCAGVIAPIQWQNTALGMKVNGNAPLLESSSIMCATGGVPISIADTTQRAVPTNLQSMAESGAPVPAPEETTEPEIIDAYWVDKDMNKTTLVEYAEKLRIRVKTENSIGKNITAKIYESDTGLDDYIHEYEWEITSNDIIYSFFITPSMFAKGGDAESFLYFTLKIEGSSRETFCDNNSEYLLVDIIRYIPNIMRAQGTSWEKGALLMEKWFSSSSYIRPTGAASEFTNYHSVPYDENIITLDWLKEFPRALDKYNELTNRTSKIWINAAAKLTLIQKLVSEGKFDSTSTTNFNFIKSNAHLSYQHHTQSRKVEDAWLNYLFLDGYTAALANASLFLCLDGYVEPFSVNSNTKGWKVVVTKVAIFLLDYYDFTGNQSLGIWDPKNETVGSTRVTEIGYKVTNLDFREWRVRHQMGGDFLVFSDMETFTVQDEFDVSSNFSIK